MTAQYKKFIAVFISFIIILTSFSLTAFANQQDNLYVSFSKTDSNTITASVFIRNAVELDSVNFSFSVKNNSGAEFIKLFAYNASDIENITDENTDKATFISKHTIKGDSVRFSGFFTSAPTSDKNLHLCDITIKTTSDFSENTPFTLSGSLSYKKYESNQKAIFYIRNTQTESISLYHTCFMGDVNNDGSVTANDARLILRHIVNLEDISLEGLPYADSDYDGKVTASDARNALRTAVNLEKPVAHQFIIIPDESITCDKGGDFTFICAVTGKTFRMRVDATEHIPGILFCTESHKCVVCKAFIGDKCEHSFDKNGACDICFSDEAEIEDITESFSDLSENIYSYYQLAEEAISDDDFYDFISYTQSIAKYLKTASDTANAITGLEYASVQLAASYKLIFNAFTECMNDSGEIYANRKNCSVISDALKLSMKLFTQSVIQNIIN